jgi:hypothetical protein
VQSEFYTKRDRQKRKIEGAPLYVLDCERVRSKASTYIVFNGRDAMQRRMSKNGTGFRVSEPDG